MSNIKIIQFGEGNFLRAFVDWMMQENSIMVVKPRPGKGLERLLEAGCRYQVRLQGIAAGQPVDTIETINSIGGAINPYEQHDEYLRLAESPDVKFVISNTTEAGIAFDPECKLSDAPALSYPGKLTQLLFHRYQFYKGDTSRGLIILPCELIFHNGRELKNCVNQYIDLWQLGEDFKQWFESCCPIYSTLVDRIVPGGNEPGVVMAEPYHLWVIEGPESLREQLPLRDGDFNLVFADSEEPYHQRKVTLLNAPHTVMSAIGTEMGLETVRDCMLHPKLGPFLQALMKEELIPTLVPMGFEEAELIQYVADVTDRFLNPHLHHRLSSIRLNAISKCKARLLPPIQRYFELKGVMPERLCKGLISNINLEG